MLMKAKKPRRCRCCKSEFYPARSTQTVCSIGCAQAAAEASRVRAEKREQRNRQRLVRQALEELKTVPKLLREAQVVFNKFIRLRDAGKPCVCCGRTSSGPTTGGDWDAGHYRSRGAASHLRFDERNVHAQLKQCNRRAWDVASYRAELVRRIGLEAVESLENDNEPHKWTREELRSIKAQYAAKYQALKKARGL